MTWVSLRTPDGKTLVARLFNAGEEQTVDVTGGATLRVGNAGGLQVQLNGQSIGRLGNSGEVREVIFRGNTYKVVATGQP